MEYKLLETHDATLMIDFLDDENTQYTLQHICAFLEKENSYGFIAKDKRRIVGFAYGYVLLSPKGWKMFYLHSIDIASDYQKQGYGTELMEYIREFSKSIGCYKMFVITNKSNTSACRCYKKAGGVHKNSDDIVYEYKD